ncbi:hypothetical protein FGG08_000061 [Glutinoglossum americanum]|uniref:DUF4048 domain-containing protein n=1 Tax=Glutinoglossum americanum TaxID=1670608 RepID=A0A9P8L689_9PEZI|nr:hypothetical protein FGG08_000061 [Glutinoglossum americanum]
MEREATNLVSLTNSQSSVEHPPILTLGGETSSNKSPLDHEQTGGLPSSTAAPEDPQIRKPLCSHSRSMSLAGAARGGKRLSLSFPIQPFSTNNSRQSTSSSTSQTPITPASPIETDSDIVPSPTKDSVSFLVALAAHERRVLELREELGRAEGELERLKRQWAMHEATKKRGELRAVEPLRPVNNNSSGRGGVGALSREEVENMELWNAEQRRRRAIVNGGLANGGLKTSTSSHRKVISGQRHTRTLSLLSPDRLKSPQPFPQPTDLNVELRDGPLDSKPELSPPMSLTSSKPSVASKQSPDFAEGDDSNTARSRNSFQGPQRDALIRTGRQMAEDFKEGLWTFIEDLRQATVGEEGVSATASRTTTSPTLASAPKGARRQGSKNSLRSNGRNTNGQMASPNTKPESSEDGGKGTLVGVKDSFWKEHGVQTPKKTAIRQKNTRNKAGLALQLAEQRKEANDDDDSWENWDSPDMKLPSSPRWSSSTFVHSDSEGPANEGSPKTRPNSVEIPTNIPWPSLADLSPENLKRTASTLIKELERQGLTPPPLEKVMQLGLGGGSKPSSMGAGKIKKGE